SSLKLEAYAKKCTKIMAIERGNKKREKEKILFKRRASASLIPALSDLMEKEYGKKMERKQPRTLA
ncbi:MAG: hypothetical protein K2G13_07210, partial [Muribaculaceae bacterium]|nr:hypothetical protein [Muribaculaceae bacterium]